MSLGARLTLVVLMADALALAVVELLYLPLRVGGVPFPVTILLAALSCPWLVSSAAELGGSRLLAVVPMLVWALALGVFGVGGPGGDVLLTDDWRSVLLMTAGAVPGAVALGRVMASRPGPPRS
ncbi:MAG TPA: hypothetical protein VFO16_04355 [Pseudonocardiaceae bacterium]|nr:hypothetical protein [Pseudonocardiaceae bacterium]